MIKKFLFTLLTIVSLTAFSQTASVLVSWDPVCNTNVSDYIVYYGTNLLTTPKTNIYPSSLDDCGKLRLAETNVCKGDYDLTQLVSGVYKFFNSSIKPYKRI